jgi:hypothetical protein
MMAVRIYYGRRRWLTVCVTCVWAGVDSVWEQEKPEARKMLENAAESHTSGARFVSRISPKDSR